MHRRIAALLMLLALLWQSVAMAAPSWASSQAQELAHSVLHWSGQAHHHHDDGSFHVGESEESARHLIADHVSVPALLPQPTAALLRLDNGAPGPCTARAGPYPFLDGPLRPPRSTR